MNKYKVLQERLEECDTSVAEIVGSISKSVEYDFDLYIYISKFDNLGNENSDFDIYLLTEENVIHTTKMYKVKRAKIDIETWSKRELLQQIINREYVDEIKLLKRFYRIKNAVAVNRNVQDVIDKEFFNVIDTIDVEKEIYKFFKLLSNSEYKNAANMYRSGE